MRIHPVSDALGGNKPGVDRLAYVGVFSAVISS